MTKEKKSQEATKDDNVFSFGGREQRKNIPPKAKGKNITRFSRVSWDRLTYWQREMSFWLSFCHLLKMLSALLKNYFSSDLYCIKKSYLFFWEKKKHEKSDPADRRVRKIRFDFPIFYFDYVVITFIKYWGAKSKILLFYVRFLRFLLFSEKFSARSKHVSNRYFLFKKARLWIFRKINLFWLGII